MQEQDECKGCSENVRLSDNEIQEAINKLAKIRNIRFTDDITHQSRLEQCSKCQYLEYGTTCLQCGCIVKIRAKLVNGTCPYPKKSKW